MRFVEVYERFIKTCPMYNNHPTVITQLQVNINSANWLIPGKIMCGAYPGLDGSSLFTKEAAIHNLSCIVRQQIDTFVCLQHELSPQNPSEIGQVNPLYKEVYPTYEAYAHTMSCNQIISHTPHELAFRHYPVVDQSVPLVHEIFNHLADMLTDLMAGRTIYLHCAKGHGRTGLYAACLLACIYPYTTPDAILRYVQYAHDRRTEYETGSYMPPASPNTQEQSAFFQRICNFVQILNDALMETGGE